MAFVKNRHDEKLEYYHEHRMHTIPALGLAWVPDDALMPLIRSRLVEVIEDMAAYLVKYPEEVVNVLVIRDGGIGDLILLEPALAAFKSAFPGVRLTLAVKDGNQPIAECFECLDAVTTLDGYKLEDYPYWVDLRGYSEKSDLRTTTHRTDIFFEGLKLDHKTSEARREPLLAIPAPSYKIDKGNKKLVVVQCSSSHKYRDWPHTAHLVDSLAVSPQFLTVLIDNKIREDFKISASVIDLRDVLDVQGMIDVIAQADVFVGPDSGGMHLALAAGVPTIGIFGIIRPDLRLRYYTAPCVPFISTTSCGSPACGEYGMRVCAVEERPDEAKCMRDVLLEDVRAAVNEMAAAKRGTQKRGAARKPAPVASSRIEVAAPRLTLVCMAQDEEHNTPRWIENVRKHPSVGRCIVIDGGSKDKTVELLRAADCEVYHHPYLPAYHDMQAMQRNISFSYVKDGTHCLVMDFDECYSEDLSRNLDALRTTTDAYIQLSRKTFRTYADAKSGRNQIKDYPDWQPRFYIWHHRFKFVRSPHHITVNVPDPKRRQWNILHFEEEGKDRAALEAKWAKMHKETRLVYG